MDVEQELSADLERIDAERQRLKEKLQMMMHKQSAAKVTKSSPVSDLSYTDAGAQRPQDDTIAELNRRYLHGSPSYELYGPDEKGARPKVRVHTQNAIGELSNQLNACNVLQTAPQENLYSKAVEVFPTPCSKDGLVMFASPPGKDAYNRNSEGGWLITNLEAQIQETLNQNLENIDLLVELIKVSGRIADDYETEDSDRYKSVPCIYHKLSKDIIIWPEKMKKAKDLAEQNDPDWQEFLKWDP